MKYGRLTPSKKHSNSLNFTREDVCMCIYMCDAEPCLLVHPIPQSCEHRDGSGPGTATNCSVTSSSGHSSLSLSFFMSPTNEWLGLTTSEVKQLDCRGLCTPKLTILWTRVSQPVCLADVAQAGQAGPGQPRVSSHRHRPPSYSMTSLSM